MKPNIFMLVVSLNNMDIFEAIFERRSIRRFIDKPIEEEKLARVLDAARWAPSVGNLQEWRFIIVRDKQKRAKLSEAALGQYWINRAFLVIVVLTKDDRITRSYGKRGKELYVKQDAAAAIQNILLAAHSVGLGACWVGSFDESMLRRELHIPEDVSVHAMIPIGYPAEKPNPPHRINLHHLVYFNQYGKEWEKQGTIFPRNY